MMPLSENTFGKRSNPHPPPLTNIGSRGLAPAAASRHRGSLRLNVFWLRQVLPKILLISTTIMAILYKK